MKNCLFEQGDYRQFIRAKLNAFPKGSHGQLTKIAKHLRVHPTLLTQILNGKKKLSPEHAVFLAEYLGLSELEIDMLLALIDLEAAGNQKLKKRIEERIQVLQTKAQTPQSKVAPHRVLNAADQAEFYSAWFYSAVRLCAGLPKLETIDAIAERLGLSRKLATQVERFLLRCRLIEEESGILRRAVQTTYLPADSILISRHHTNWRLKAIENFERLQGHELAFTAPISLSEKDLAVVKKILLEAIDEISKIVKNSDDEHVACLNMDLFRIDKLVFEVAR